MNIPLKKERDRAEPSAGTMAEPSVNKGSGRVPIDIEALLVWAYARQAVQVIDERGDGPPWLGGLRSGDGCARLAWYGALGARPDGGQYKGLFSPTPDDAEIIHGVVLTLDKPARALVINHAKARSVPAWDLTAARVAASVPSDRWDGLNGRPKPKVVYTDAKRRWGYCPITIQWLVSPIEVKRARAAYRAWHAALVHIRASLVASNRLGRFRPTGPSRPPQPWQPEPQHLGLDTGANPLT